MRLGSGRSGRAAVVSTRVRSVPEHAPRPILLIPGLFLLAFRELFDEHSTKFAKSGGCFVAEHSHDLLTVGGVHGNDRVVVCDSPLEFCCELAVDHCGEQPYVRRANSHASDVHETSSFRSTDAMAGSGQSGGRGVDSFSVRILAIWKPSHQARAREKKHAVSMR